MSRSRYDSPKGFKPKSLYDLELFFRHQAKMSRARSVRVGKRKVIMENIVTTEVGWNLYADWVSELRKKDKGAKCR